MLKFFRKIRYRLLSEGETGKYFKYAIGEIFLVVVGILIALQINNWNENRKSSKIRNNYYKQVSQDLAKDTIYINRYIKILDTSLTKYQNYLERIPEVENTNELLPLLSSVDWEFGYISFNTNTIESLISTGDIKLMPDEIRNRLLDLKTTQNVIIKTTSGNNSVFLDNTQQAIGLGLINYIINIDPKLLNQLNKDEDITKSINILNGSFKLKEFTEKHLLRNMQDLLVSTEELSDLINQELNK